MPFQILSFTVVTLLICILLFVAYRQRARLAIFIFNLLESGKKYAWPLLSDILITGALILAGYQIALDLHVDKAFSIGTACSVAFVFAIKFFRYRKFSLGPAREIEHSHKNRANLGAVLRKFNNLNPARFYNDSPRNAEKNVVVSLLKNQIDLMYKWMRLGFHLGEREEFTASLLFFESKKGVWMKWQTVNRLGVVDHPSSKWPKKREEFLLKESLYRRPLDEAPYQAHDLVGHYYKSVLSIPFYLPKDSSMKEYEEDVLYAVLSYATNKPGLFKKLDDERFLTFFLLESSIIERAAYRIFRGTYEGK